MDEATLRAGARRAYERGRLTWALGLGGLALLPVAVAVFASAQPWHASAFGLVLFVVVVGLWVRGGVGARAVFPGLVAGMVPMLAGLLSCTIGHACRGPSCYAMCLPLCAAGGIAAGMLLARRAARVSAERGGGLGFVVSAGLVACLVGAMGCVAVGLGGLGGLALGLLLGTTPAFVPAVRGG